MLNRGGKNPLSFFLLAILVFSAGCVPATGKHSSPNISSPSSAAEYSPARLAIFLNLLQPVAPAVSVTIESVEVLTGDSWVPLNSQPRTISAEDIGGGQIFIAGHGVPMGTVERLRFVLQKAGIVKGGSEVPLTIEKSVVDMVLPALLEIERGDSRSIFVTWDVLASLQGTSGIAPVMIPAPQTVPLTVDLAYAACPDIDTLYVIRTDKNWVVGSIGVQGRPIYPVVNTASDKVYVLTAGTGDIKVVEIASNKVIDRFKIPLMYSPSFMALSPDGLWAYVLEEKSEYLTKIDLSSGSLAERVHLSTEPNYLVYLGQHELLAVSSTYGNEVLLLNPETLATVDSIGVGSSPQGLAIWQGLLYIAESGADTVAIYDLATRRINSRLTVGREPARIALADNRLYVANTAENSLAVLLPGQFSASGDIALTGRPSEMAATENRRWLYVGIAGSHMLQVVDFTSNRVTGAIELGAEPVGIAVVQ